MVCEEWHKELPQEEETWPTVVLAVFIERPGPFLPEVLERVTQLDYPKSKMSLFVHNAVSQSLCILTYNFLLQELKICYNIIIACKKIRYHLCLLYF